MSLWLPRINARAETAGPNPLAGAIMISIRTA